MLIALYIVPLFLAYIQIISSHVLTMFEEGIFVLDIVEKLTKIEDLFISPEKYEEWKKTNSGKELVKIALVKLNASQEFISKSAELEILLKWTQQIIKFETFGADLSKIEAILKRQYNHPIILHYYPERNFVGLNPCTHKDYISQLNVWTVRISDTDFYGQNYPQHMWLDTTYIPLNLFREFCENKFLTLDIETTSKYNVNADSNSKLWFEQLVHDTSKYVKPYEELMKNTVTTKELPKYNLIGMAEADSPFGLGRIETNPFSPIYLATSKIQPIETNLIKTMINAGEVVSKGKGKCCILI